MLHKHSSAEKAQVYFGITEKLKHDAANFFIYIQPKLGQIYDNSICRALGEHFNHQDIRDKHLTHISTLLTGGIDHRFIEDSHSLHKKYAERDVTTGEYVKLYQLIISYLSGEAHKKHWWRYKKYRDLNRSIRNLLLFDLAIATSALDSESSRDRLDHSKKTSHARLSIEHPLELNDTLEELTHLIESSQMIINECYQVIQSILDLSQQSKTLPLIETINTQPSLFINDFEDITESLKTPSNLNQPAFDEILTLTQGKIHTVSKIISTKSEPLNSKQIKTLEAMITDIQENIETISSMGEVQKNIKTSSFSLDALHDLLQKSSTTIGFHLNSLDKLKERKYSLK